MIRGFAALAIKLGDDLSETLVTVGKRFGVVVITLAGVLQHCTEAGRSTLHQAPSWNRGLVGMLQGAGKSLS